MKKKSSQRNRNPGLSTLWWKAVPEVKKSLIDIDYPVDRTFRDDHWRLYRDGTDDEVLFGDSFSVILDKENAALLVNRILTDHKSDLTSCLS